MKVRWWPHSADTRIASTRIRCITIMQELALRGVDAGLFSRGDQPDILILSKRYDEQSLAVAKELQRRGTVVILDLCDNHFHADKPDQASDRRSAQLQAAVQAVDVVCASTPALAALILERCPGVSVEVIGDAVEGRLIPQAWQRWLSPIAEAKLRQLEKNLQQAEVRLLWFGNHGSSNVSGGMLDILMLRATLADLAQRHRVSLTVISNNAEKFSGVRRQLAVKCEYLPWHRVTFSRAVSLHDIALIPVGLNPFSACKTNNRLTTALAHGLAVAADPVPSYEEFSECAVLGDWAQGFERLVSDTEYRRQLVARGQLKLADWTLDKIAGQWLGFLGKRSGKGVS